MNSEERYTEVEKKEMLSFVEDTIENKLKHQEDASINPVPDYLKEERSCFVTLHTKDGQLRGCIGHIMAFEPLYDNLKRNALNAAFQDPRFPPVSSTEEFENLNIEISILTPTERVDSYKNIVLGKHGIILKCGTANSVFLPQVAPEQGWDIETTLTHLSLKAGLPSDAWQFPETEFEVFEAIVFGS